jgi:hypothetical protein
MRRDSERRIPKSAGPSRGAFVLALWISLLTFGVFGGAEAHTTIVPPPAMVVGGAIDNVESVVPMTTSDDESCPAVAGHGRSHCCVGSASCHAMTAVIAFATNLDYPGCASDAASDPDIARSDVAPLFHPPRS